MSIEYGVEQVKLSTIIEDIRHDATYVIPNLQRPYVWSPQQVTMLVDSLFRRWPFGSLLLWEVKSDAFPSDEEGIPSRPFWEVVDRADAGSDKTTSKKGAPSTYQMVLDGQQRIQSLVIALGGDQWGFQLHDAEWAQALDVRGGNSWKHWSKAYMCLDLERFEEEWEAKAKLVRKMEVWRILNWAILDPANSGGKSLGYRPKNYKCPVDASEEFPGRFIRLSRIWNLVENGLSQDEYLTRVDELLNEYKVHNDKCDMLRNPLANFMTIVERVKTESLIHSLKIKSFTSTSQWTKDDYSDAIVSIFTRLNTAGRTLTQEEITMAWLTVYWEPAVTEGKDAGKCIDELLSLFTDLKFVLETDKIVSLVSYIWAVHKLNGRLLEPKDYLKGAIIQKMAKEVAPMWQSLKKWLSSGAQLVRDRNLVKSQGSFNAVIAFLTWYQLAYSRLEELHTKVVVGDSLEKQLQEMANTFLDRWIFGSQWANVWAVSAVDNFKNFASDLSDLHSKLAKCTADDFIPILNGGVSQLMNRVADKASDQIANITARGRQGVGAYYYFLWVWHRLNEQRWNMSKIPMRDGTKKAPRLEVDHCVAYQWWKNQVEAEINRKFEDFHGTDEERSLIAPDGFETKDDAISFINKLGNCSLLDKYFNIVKSDGQMWAFMKEVKEFKEGTFARPAWENALQLPACMTEPDSNSLSDLQKAIEERDLKIRKELAEFIAGSRVRVDV